MSGNVRPNRDELGKPGESSPMAILVIFPSSEQRKGRGKRPTAWLASQTVAGKGTVHESPPMSFGQEQLSIQERERERAFHEINPFVQLVSTGGTRSQKEVPISQPLRNRTTATCLPTCHFWQLNITNASYDRTRTWPDLDLVSMFGTQAHVPRRKQCLAAPCWSPFLKTMHSKITI